VGQKVLCTICAPGDDLTNRAEEQTGVVFTESFDWESPEQYRRTLRAIWTLLISTLVFSCLGCQSTSERFTFEIDQAAPHIDRVLVKKKDHKLLLMNGDAVVRSYSVVLARGGLEPKQRMGTTRRQKGFMSSTQEIKRADSIVPCMSRIQTRPTKSGARKLGVDPGGAIMIHGLQNGLGWLGASQRLVDWTDGCMVVTDEQIEEIWRLVPNGTPIEIRP